MFQELNDEQRFLILASRLTFSDDDIKEMKNINFDKIDWFQVLQYSAKNKVIPLIWSNINRFNIKLNKQIRRIFKYYYLATGEKNKIIMSEYDKIAKAFSDSNVKFSPVKGIYLIPNMYLDPGIRTVNDIDLLIKRRDADKIDSILTSLGYIKGDYEHLSNTIQPISKKKNMLWKMKMNSLYPYRKIINSPFLNVIDIDFSFALDFNNDEEPVSIMIDSGKQKCNSEVILKQAHFFVHQCCHHYKEASNAAWIIKGSDLNIIKFCDVREYMLKFMSKDMIIEAIDFSNKYGFSEAVYFVLYYLKIIYNESFEEDFLKMLNCNEKFLNYFGRNDFLKALEWKKSFWTRLFSDNNSDEITEEAKYLSLNYD